MTPLCIDADRADDTLRRTLAPAKAPGAWTVVLRVSRVHGILRGEGEITDDHGAPVAHREFTNGPSFECASVARAVGVWASLVLDAEVDRAAHAAATVPSPAAKLASAQGLERRPVADARPEPEGAARVLRAPEARPRQAERRDRRGRVPDVRHRHGRPRRSGVFLIIEIDNGVYLRPMIAAGRTVSPLLPTGDVYGTWGITRFDVCLRIPGMYNPRRGLQVDTCGGADLGFLLFRLDVRRPYQRRSQSELTHHPLSSRSA